MNELLAKYKEIVLLGNIQGLLGWDTEVNLPVNGSKGRALQSALLTGLIVDRWNDKEFKSLLFKLNKSKKISLKEKAILRNLNHSAKVYYKVPKKILIKESELTSKAFVVWTKARKENNFNLFAPYLEELLNLSKEISEYLGYKNNPYDALLDLYEPGLTADFCKFIFDKLTPELVNVIKNIKQENLSKNKTQISTEEQKKLCIFILEKMGYDFNSGRMDIAPHPFETTLGRHDVRITNRYKKDSFIESLTGAMHEGGHALYEQGVNEKFEYTPLDHGVSLGIHESQSRFWENIIGRSQEFAIYFASKVNISSKDLFKLTNYVKPGFIRVEADEVTYNLHIALRFEIENDLINGKIEVKDLPEVWNSKMKKYLGIVPKNNSMGVLQDVHWAHNSFGYFPTYTLGNLYGAQWRTFMKKELDINKLVREGNFKPILSWLRKNIHQHGSLYYPEELVKKVTGENLNPDYFLNYIKEKYQIVY
jgi:carboxypeptidase Taq